MESLKKLRYKMPSSLDLRRKTVRPELDMQKKKSTETFFFLQKGKCLLWCNRRPSKTFLLFRDGPHYAGTQAIETSHYLRRSLTAIPPTPPINPLHNSHCTSSNPRPCSPLPCSPQPTAKPTTSARRLAKYCSFTFLVSLIASSHQTKIVLR